MTSKDTGMKALLRFLLIVAIMFMIAPVIAQGQVRGDRFSVGTLSQAQLVNATRAPDGSRERREFLKATCEQQLEAANRLPDQHFDTCAQLADYFANAGVRSCPAEVSLDYLVGKKVGHGEHRSREPGEQCLWRDGVWIVSLNCGNIFSAQPSIPLTPEPLRGAQGLAGQPGTDCMGLIPIDPPRTCLGKQGPQGPRGEAASTAKEGRSCWRWSSWCPWATLVGLAGAGYAGYECAHVWCVNHVVVNSGSSAYASASRRPRSFGIGFNANPAKVERLVGLILRR